MKDPFSGLKKAKEKDLRAPLKKNLADLARKHFLENTKFTYFPAKTFEPLLDLPEYSYLQNGLYVANSKLIVDDIVLDACDAVVDLKKPVKGKELDGFPWDQSKEIVGNLGAKLLTPAEYICAYEWLMIGESLYRGIKAEMLDSFRDKTEWLDALVRKDKTGKSRELDVTTHSRVYNGKVDGGTERKAILFDMSSYCTLDDVDRTTGFPKELNGKPGMYFMQPTGEYGAAKRGHTTVKLFSQGERLVSMPLLSVSNKPDSYSQGTGVRLCYTLEKPIEDIEEKTEKSG